MDEREKYIRRVFETALFFRDMHEEGNDGQTTAIELLKPIASVSNVAVRKFVLHDLYLKQGLSLTKAAVQLARWCPDGKELPPFRIEDIERELCAICSEEDRPVQFVKNQEKVIVRRAFLRAARYIQRIRTEDAPAHSRVVERFIPDAFVPRGFGKGGTGHREHVIPCVFLRDECLVRFDDGAKLDQVADFLQGNVVIVDITKQQQKRLDRSPNNGGLGLKNTMPMGWQFDSDCIFQRLHCAKIEFDPPDGFTPCTCSH